MTNKIHFVGAGPGDKELITLKGYKLLSNFADLWVTNNKFHSEAIIECSHTNLSFAG